MKAVRSRGHPPGALTRALAIPLILAALLFASLPAVGAVLPYGSGSGGSSPLPHAAPARSDAVDLGARFPAPQGSGDPVLPAPSSPTVRTLLQHRTDVASLVAHRGAGYSYASGVAWLAYAPWDQAFYVAAPPSSVDEILAGSTTASTVIAVGSDPFGVAVDTATQEVWVTNTGSNNVSVINGTSQSVIANIAVPSEPLGIAVNPTGGRVFVAANGTNETSVLSVTPARLVTNWTVGAEPTGVAYDPASDRVFVSDHGSDEVSVLNGSTGAPLGTVVVGSEPDGLTIDNATDAVYVANEGSDNVSVISAATETVDAAVPVVANGFTPDLQGVTYDSAHNLVWVTAGFSAVVINTSEERAVDEIAYDPSGIAYDSANGDVCLTNSANTTFGCFVFGTGTQPDANVTFAETGLPTGTTWSVNLSTGGGWNGAAAIQAIHGTSFVFGVDYWTHLSGYDYTFSIAPAGGMVPSLLRGDVNNTGANPSWVNVTFLPGSVYDVWFNETGLSSGAQYWSATLGGFPQRTNGTSLVFPEANGTYAYTTSGPTGWTTANGQGNVTVSGSSRNVTLNWTHSTGGSGSPYTITFNESGLPAGTRWGVSINNSSASQGGSTFAPTGLEFAVSAGHYDYAADAPVGWNSTLASGVVVVANASITVHVGWVWQGFYPVTFTEAGLPNGTLWGVDIGSVTNWSDTDSVVLDEANGTYAFHIAPLSGYTSSTTNQTVTVEGSPVTVSVQWTATVTYLVTFEETGLANGTSWNVSLTGPAGVVSLGSTTPSITRSEPNGSYSFSIPPIVAYGRSQYVASPANGSFGLSGAGHTVDVRFSLVGGFFNVTFAEVGLPVGTSWSIGLGGTDVQTTGATIVAAELNGSYPFTVGGAFGYDPTPSAGTVTVRGGPVLVPIHYTIAPGFYPVTFAESGLATGTPWSVTLGSTLTSAAPTIVFAEPNGSFPYSIGTVEGYLTRAPGGPVTVSGTAPPTVNVTFVSTDLYAITFTETGLPAGTGWAVSIGSQLDSSLGPNVTLLETNGTYGYLVLPVAGYVTRYDGFVAVAGANRSEAVHFVPETYPVVVVEFGLPNGTTWSVVVTNASTGYNATFSTSGAAMIFDLPNGTYAIRVHAAGYQANVSSPNFTVDGKLLGSSPLVQFRAPGRPGGGGPTPAFSALVIGTAAAAVLVAVAALALVAGLWRRRTARREGAEWIRELSDAPSVPGPGPKP